MAAGAFKSLQAIRFAILLVPKHRTSSTPPVLQNRQPPSSTTHITTSLGIQLLNLLGLEFFFALSLQTHRAGPVIKV
ncbi:hypothetical protein RchiOBHm_Chr5g0022481 [Rosa chinensis]|uniref:Uncharacterized protein n=1 Tax=Rosa chinensis TaxID=74649 RepID=A0A2P6Q7U1_ROSCH|nr:hypothetical protein RchiOBHm_Chr5g0022481 [Rosa chinensis]